MNRMKMITVALLVSAVIAIAEPAIFEDKCSEYENHLIHVRQVMKNLMQEQNEMKLRQEKQDGIILSQKRTIETLQEETKKNMSDLTTLQDSLRTDLQVHQKQQLDMDNKQSELLNSTEADIGDLQANFSLIDRKINNIKIKTEKAGFTAAAGVTKSEWSSGILKLAKVISNVGRGYDAGSGIFTAPVAGNYVFNINIVSYNDQHVTVEIVLNDEPKVRLIASNSAGRQHDTGTNTVLLSLKQGDRVWAQHYAGKGYHGYTVPFTTFSGFLL